MGKTKVDLKKWINEWDELVKSKNEVKIKSLLADNVQFYSPAIFKPSSDKEYICEVLTCVIEVIDQFHYPSPARFDVDDEQLTITALFKGRVKGKSGKDGWLAVEGVDMFKLNEEGKIVELKVMLRPYNALTEVLNQVLWFLLCNCQSCSLMFCIYMTYMTGQR